MHTNLHSGLDNERSYYYGFQYGRFTILLFRGDTLLIIIYVAHNLTTYYGFRS